MPWQAPLSADRFPDRGYIPQALTHGTITCINLERSREFYRNVLGLDVVSPSRSVKPHYIKHPETPWYVVSLEKLAAERKLLTPSQRYTVTVDSRTDAADAHRWLTQHRAEAGITELGELNESEDATAFLLADPIRYSRAALEKAVLPGEPRDQFHLVLSADGVARVTTA